MMLILIIWTAGLLLLVPVLCALGYASHRLDEETDEGLRCAMLRELARRRSDRRRTGRASEPVSAERRQAERRLSRGQTDRLTAIDSAERSDRTAFAG